MSARKVQVVLKPAARQDIRDALIYTFEQWGPTQRDRYRDALDLALATLQANPSIGRPRKDVGQQIRSYPIGQHVLYYQYSDDVVTVLRILHRRMDALRQLSGA